VSAARSEEDVPVFLGGALREMRELRGVRGEAERLEDFDHH